jgi:hypothetical protein
MRKLRKKYEHSPNHRGDKLMETGEALYMPEMPLEKPNPRILQTMTFQWLIPKTCFTY